MTNIRPATLADINDLLGIEEKCFLWDRLSRRNFHWLLTKANAQSYVAEAYGQVVGYFILLFQEKTSIARLYSIAVLPKYRGLKIAESLLDKADELAAKHNCSDIRLEVRPDNPSAIQLYEKLGYIFFCTKPLFYDDNSDAYGYRKIYHTKENRS